ncbi:MAG: hypothetical protein GC179_14520 [Anaerolineaceae bacterium]|nr:hypothetical protein [Anaerolineaceae bacterium]
MFRLRYGVVIFFVCISTACSSTAPLVAEPTQTLVIPTITITPIPQTPTLTLTPLPRAGDLSTATPAVGETAATDEANQTIDDPVAAELVGLAQRRVAELTSMPVRRVQVVDVTAYKWTDISLGCPNPDTTYPTQEVDGYRIVLSVDSQEYIFHTDFDRIVACDAAKEKLPLTPTPTS